MSDLNFNDYENIEYEIRPPDNPIREKLVDYSINNYDYDNIAIDYDYDNIELQFAINESMREQEELQFAINESIKEQEELDKKQLELLEKTRTRVETFKDVLFKIKKISMIDKKIMELYNILEPIIDSYCACNIDIYECET